MTLARACAANCFFVFLLFNAAASGLAAEAERSVTPAGEKRTDNNPNMETKKIGLAIHGGAGTIERSNMTPEKEREYRAGLEHALKAGYEILKRGGSSLDATEAAVRVLEDDPHFNAGRGSVFTSAGTNEMDASIMEGKTLKAGAVGSVQHIKKSYQPRPAGNGKISARDARLRRGGSIRESKRDRTGGPKIFLYAATMGRSAENEGCRKEQDRWGREEFSDH